MVGANKVAGPNAGKTIWYAWRRDGSLAERRANGQTARPSIVRDPSGLPRSVGNTTLQYGPSRRPTRVARDGVTLATYQYNAFGQRTAAISAGRRTDYFYLDNRVVAESRGPLATPPSDSAGTAVGRARPPPITRRYIYAEHVLVGIIDYPRASPGTESPSGAGATLYAVHADMLGAPRAVTDANQAIRWLAAYTPTGDRKSTRLNSSH